MSDTLLRQWVMLRAIPRAPRRISTRELWQKLCDEGYALTKRTVERDLNTLSLQFGFTCDTSSSGQLWFWPRDAAAMDVAGLEPSAALAFVLSREHLSHVLPAAVLQELAPWFKQADAVLDAHAQQPLGAWRSKVIAIPRGPVRSKPAIVPEVHAAVTRALLAGNQLTATYRARGKEHSKSMQLHPLGLVAREGLVYLVATAWDYPEPYHYALHRFELAKHLDIPAHTPTGFSLDRYVREQAAFSYPLSEKKLALVADFDAAITPHLIEQSLSADQTLLLQPNGRWRCTATVDDTAELRWWLLGFGNKVDVRAPATMRKQWRALSCATKRTIRQN